MGGRGRPSENYYLKMDDQGKHYPWHRNWQPDKSPITVSPERLQELFNKYHGTGEKVGNREIVNFEEVIGQIKIYETGEMQDTIWGTIHYDEYGGYHIVPYYQQNQGG